MNRVLENATVTLGNKQERLQAAVAALDHYGLAGARLTLLNSGQCATYRVDVPQEAAFLRHAYLGRVAGKRFVLRMPHSEEQAQATRSELVWLAALLRDTELAVPEPVPTRTGSLLAPVTTAGNSGYCVLLRWVEADDEPCAQSAATMHKLGSYIAALHNHAESYTVPADFVRPYRNGAWLAGLRANITAATSSGAMAEGDVRLFEQAAELLKGAMQRLGEDRSVFGLVHGGLHSGNYLFAAGQLCCLDFSGCGWGYYLHDLASALAAIERSSDYLPLREALLCGYRQVRPLYEEHESLLEAFMPAHHIENTSHTVRGHNAYVMAWGI